MVLITLSDRAAAARLPFIFYCECRAGVYIDDVGKCVLKQEGGDATQQFTDILHAIEHLAETDLASRSTLSVYDPLGKVTFKLVL